MNLMDRDRVARMLRSLALGVAALMNSVPSPLNSGPLFDASPLVGTIETVGRESMRWAVFKEVVVERLYVRNGADSKPKSGWPTFLARPTLTVMGMRCLL